MRVNTYVSFNGNCAGAIAFYWRVFGAPVEIMRYKDAPAGSGFLMPPGAENLIMHAKMNLGSDMILFCDAPPGQPVRMGDNMSISVSFNDAAAARSAFNAFTEGGRINVELGETVFNPCYGSITDKFGIQWQIMVDDSH